MKSDIASPGVRFRLSVPEAIARREVVLDRIRTLLAKRPVSAVDLIEQLGLQRGTAYRYLDHLVMLGEAHRPGARDGKGRELWKNGRAPALAAAAEDVVDVELPSATTVPATQVGLHRDPLVAALFGPARGEKS